MSRKTLFVSASIVAHAALLGGLTLASMWRIDKLPMTRDVGTVALAGPAASTGGAPASSGLTTPQRRVTREVVQPTEAVRAPVTAAEAVTVSIARLDDGAGAGGGGGGGSDIGDGGGGGFAVDGGCEFTGGCVEPPAAPPVAPPIVVEVPPAPKVVTPSVMRSLRLSGEAQIQPSADDQRRIVQASVARVTGTFKVCIDTGGHVARVTAAHSTGYAGYDARLIAAMQTWRYRPYAVHGTPVTACGAVTFVFAPQR